MPRRQTTRAVVVALLQRPSGCRLFCYLLAVFLYFHTRRACAVIASPGGCPRALPCGRGRWPTLEVEAKRSEPCGRVDTKQFSCSAPAKTPEKTHALPKHPEETPMRMYTYINYLHIATLPVSHAVTDSDKITKITTEMRCTVAN